MVVPVCCHVVQEAAGVGGDQVGAKRPRRIHVPERRREVGHVGIGEPLVRPRVGEVDRFTVDGEVDLAERHHLQAGRRDDDVGLEVVARLQLDPGLGERDDPIGDDRHGACLDRLEQVAVGHEAETLIPRRVARREVRVDVVLGPERLANPTDEVALRLVGVGAHALVHELLQLGVLPAGDVVGDGVGQHLSQPVGDHVDVGPGGHIGG